MLAKYENVISAKSSLQTQNIENVYENSDSQQSVYENLPKPSTSKQATDQFFSLDSQQPLYANIEPQPSNEAYDEIPDINSQHSVYVNLPKPCTSKQATDQFSSLDSQQPLYANIEPQPSNEAYDEILDIDSQQSVYENFPKPCTSKQATDQFSSLDSQQPVYANIQHQASNVPSDEIPDIDSQQSVYENFPKPSTSKQATDQFSSLGSQQFLYTNIQPQVSNELYDEIPDINSQHSINENLPKPSTSKQATDQVLDLAHIGSQETFDFNPSHMTRYQLRLAKDSERHKEMRSQETKVHALRRKKKDSERHKQMRSQESEAHAVTRLRNDAERHQRTRAEETKEQSSRRTQRDTDWHRLNRQSSPVRRRENERTVQARKMKKMKRADLKEAGFDYDGDEFEGNKFFDIGQMNKKCPLCGALKWPKETPSLCCHSGKVKVPLIEVPPEPLKSLLFGKHKDSKEFLNNIRSYNMAFNMTSFGTQVVKEHGYNPSFKIKGQNYHRIGSLMPEGSDPPSFVQIYFIGNFEDEVNRRCEISGRANPQIIAELQEMFHSNNELIKTFKTILEKEGLENHRIAIRADRIIRGQHKGTTNAPAVEEIAAILSNDEKSRDRDIVLTMKGGQLMRINEHHRKYDALQYPIIFWQGQDTYSISFKEESKIRNGGKNGTTTNQFYSFLFMVRDQDSDVLHRCKDLFQQLMVDSFCKIESERLGYLGRSQDKVRAADYDTLRRGLMDQTGDLTKIGKRTVLPSSFTGGPRYYHKKQQDAMAYVRKYGKPSFFITFTTNPKWPEITGELIENQVPADRPDIVARVFKLKVDKLMALLREAHFFGEVQCDLYSIEWQKRGLPHAHILIWLVDPIHPRNADRVISAEIPDPKKDPVLHDIVINRMIHGPCGVNNPNSKCMVDKKCSKKYPRPFLNHTISDVDGYPQYKRRHPNDGGIEANHKNQILDNSMVVPFNPGLLKIFDAHINVELCSSIQSIKYVTKYVTKGSDMATVEISKRESNARPKDEIGDFKSGRYVSSPEAAWRILDYPIHVHHPPVMGLAMHLESMQVVTFDPDHTRLEDIEQKDTHLTAFFKLCMQDNFAKTLMYPEVPGYFRWESTPCKWLRRKTGTPVVGWSGVKKEKTLGRVYTIHPSQEEAFYLRMLLHKVKGPTSFESARTVNGEVCSTFREACLLLGLIEDDSQWNECLNEAYFEVSASAMRALFCTILHHCNVANILRLWENHKEGMAEDVWYQAQRVNPNVTVDDVFAEVLVKIEDKLLQIGGHTLEHYGLPRANRAPHALSHEMLRAKDYNKDELKAYVEENVGKLNDEQKFVYDKIVSELDAGGFWFLDAPGGTGKTFLSKLLLAKIRSEDQIAIAVASSGIAATLLPGGRTAHSGFKLPFELLKDNQPISSITKESAAASVIKKAKLIIWDECTMSHKRAFETVDRLLQDLHESKKIMGGTLVLMTGDFRQTLPVVTKGTRADEMDASIKSSSLWKRVKKLHLKTNMRALITGDASAAEWSSVLLDIGDGKLRGPDECLIPPPHVLVKSKEDLIKAIFPQLSQNYTNEDWLGERAILAPKNEDVDKINNELMRMIPGEERSFRSFDKTKKVDDATNYPTEFLNSLSPPGFPPYLLTLKVGAPVILLRNLSPPEMVNGTRLIITKIKDNVLTGKILNGTYKGQVVTIPRIRLTPTGLPFEFDRVQYPLKVSFAMTINKAQGQTLEHVGLNLEHPCFSHGQLYVGCSRVGKEKNLKIFAPEGKTKNIVYTEAFDG